MTISQHGESLLNRVAGERRSSNVTGRPLLFVAHSLEGLLVKEALVEAKKQKKQASKFDILINFWYRLFRHATPRLRRR